MKNAIFSQVSSRLSTTHGCPETPIDIHLQRCTNLISNNLYSDVDFPYHSQQTFCDDTGPPVVPKMTLDHFFTEENYPISVPVQDGFQTIWDYDFVHQSTSLFEPSGFHHTGNARKRLAEVPGGLNKRQNTRPITDPGFINSTNIVKRSVLPFEEQLQKSQTEKVSTGRKSQKLTDQITTLQKLVSPYGKTDTASVLLEAFLSIKALQDQLQNNVRMLADESKFDMRGDEQVDLRSIGLCLVPITLSEKLATEDCMSPPMHICQYS